jgi:hypothetical protein
MRDPRAKKKQIFARNIESFPIESLSYSHKMKRNFARERNKLCVVAR